MKLKKLTVFTFLAFIFILQSACSSSSESQKFVFQGDFYYSSSNGEITSNIPDYSQYNEKDVTSILGEPKTVVTDDQKIKEMLGNDELNFLVAEEKKGNLTKEQIGSMYFAASDLSIASDLGTKLKAFVYEEEKPTAYLSENQDGTYELAYIQPVKKFVEFKK